VIAVAGATLLAGLVVGVGSAGTLVRATSALFIAVYVLALFSAVRILDGRVRLAAVAALAASLVLAAFSGWFLVVPVGAALVSLGLRRALVSSARPCEGGSGDVQRPQAHGQAA
jgi:amino acid efflux transporter